MDEQSSMKSKKMKKVKLIQRYVSGIRMQCKQVNSTLKKNKEKEKKKAEEVTLQT